MSAVLQALDAAAVRRWYAWGLAALGATREEIDSLNVFPVADGDTGTNLYLTLGSAVDGEPLAAPASDLAETATRMARRSLLGARGSSGVILSQLLRGVAEVLAEPAVPARGRALTRALERGVALAYAAVAHPVEGTMLSVARAAAEAGRATGSDDLPTVVDAVVKAARRALEATPSQLEVLARAGVVDAGGRGIVVLLDVLQAVVEERAPSRPQPHIAHPQLEPVDTAAAEPSPGYEVMYLIDARDERIPDLRGALDAIGDDVVVSGGDGLWNVHVHTGDAGAAVRSGLGVGHPHEIRIHRIAHPGRDSAPNDRAAAAAGARALVVVVPTGSPASALAGWLAAAGAQVVPSAVALTAALRRADAAEATVLTFSAPDLLAAVEAAAGSLRGRHQVEIVPARSPVQLFAALAVHDAARPLADEARAMAAAVSAVRCAEVHREGPALVGLIDGEPAFNDVTGDDALALAVRLLREMLTATAELVTVVAAGDLAPRVAESVRASHPGVEVATVAADIGEAVWLGVE